MSAFRDKGGWWVVGQNLICLVILALGWVDGDRSWPVGWRRLGLGFCVISALLGISGMVALGRSLTPYPRPLPDGCLVRSGVYGLVRHPLYSSLIFLAFGWSLSSSSAVALAASLGLGLVLDAKARREERWLGARYPEYADYRRAVRRFVPWVY